MHLTLMNCSVCYLKGKHKKIWYALTLAKIEFKSKQLYNVLKMYFSDYLNLENI